MLPASSSVTNQLNLRCHWGGKSFLARVAGPRTTIAELTAAISRAQKLLPESVRLFHNGGELVDPSETLMSQTITPEHSLIVVVADAATAASTG